MTSFDALVWTWSVWGIALIVVCVLVAVGSWLSDRRGALRRLAEQPTPAPEALDAGLERLRAALVPAQRTGGEDRV